jgi:ABC-type transport system involved in multi-copper enzyme maturation permease subunit
MQMTSTVNMMQYLNPLRLAGPIFDKELRVTSRRRRLYALRFGYVCLLLMVTLNLWLSIVGMSRGPGAVQVARYGEAGRWIAVMVVWFQFLTGQLLAAVLLSDAIGSELRQRTLDVLLVTPVGSVQIVLGKLLSKLLQLVSLLAVSLPILAVARVFGGVPWDYVIAGLCITLSVGVFTGSLSLLASIKARHSYHAVMVVVLWYLVVWGLLVMPLAWLGIGNMTVTSVLRLMNPFIVLGDLTGGVLSGSGRSLSAAMWPLHCLILLAGATVPLAWSVWRVRKVALRVIPLRVDGTPAKTAASKRRAHRRAIIRPVIDSPIVWKEGYARRFRTWGRRLLYAGLLTGVLGVIIAVLIIAGVPLYPVFLPILHALQPVFASMAFFFIAQILQLLLVINLAIGAAGAVTKEREARTWPILLTTPLDDYEIIKGKAIAILQRNLLLLVAMPVLYVPVFLFAPADEKQWWQFIPWAVLLAGGLVSTIVFLLGTGLYLSTRLKTTTAAVATTFAVYFAPSFFCCGLSPSFSMSTGAFMVMGAGHIGGLFLTLAAMVLPAVIYAVIGLLFARAAIRRVRREVF